MHVVAAKAVCFKEALSKEFKKYTSNVISNAKTLSETLLKIILKYFQEELILI